MKLKHGISMGVTSQPVYTLCFSYSWCKVLGQGGDGYMHGHKTVMTPGACLFFFTRLVSDQRRVGKMAVLYKHQVSLFPSLSVSHARTHGHSTHVTWHVAYSTCCIQAHWLHLIWNIRWPWRSLIHPVNHRVSHAAYDNHVITNHMLRMMM